MLGEKAVGNKILVQGWIISLWPGRSQEALYIGGLYCWFNALLLPSWNPWYLDKNAHIFILYLASQIMEPALHLGSEFHFLSGNGRSLGVWVGALINSLPYLSL